MGKWVHRLSNVDLAAKVADCTTCGTSVDIDIRAGHSPRCSESRRAENHVYKMSSGRAAPHHGLTYLEAENLRNSRSCEICGSDNKKAVDHNHATGVVRGVLCTACNLAIGLFKDDPKLLRIAADYLER